MTDNVQITAGLGTIIATDSVSGSHIQYVKLVDGTSDSGSPISGDSIYGLDVDPTRLPAGENHLGEIGNNNIEIDLDCSLDTNLYSGGDVFFDTQELPNATRINGGYTTLQNFIVNDEDNQGVDFDLIFLNANNSLGTENSVPNISDVDARTIITKIPIIVTDYYSLGGLKIANPNIIPKLMKSASGSTSLFVGGIINGSGTYSGSGIKIKFFFKRD